MKPKEMCFGLSEKLDRESFFCYLQLLGREEFAQEFAKRASQTEIENFIHLITGMMKDNFSENEYHSIFLQDKKRTKKSGVTTL